MAHDKRHYYFYAKQFRELIRDFWSFPDRIQFMLLNGFRPSLALLVKAYLLLEKPACRRDLERQLFTSTQTAWKVIAALEHAGLVEHTKEHYEHSNKPINVYRRVDQQ